MRVEKLMIRIMMDINMFWVVVYFVFCCLKYKLYINVDIDWEELFGLFVVRVKMILNSLSFLMILMIILMVIVGINKGRVMVKNG